MEIYEAVLKEGIEAHKALGIKFDEKALKRSVADGLIGEVLLYNEGEQKRGRIQEGSRRGRSFL